MANYLCGNCISGIWCETWGEMKCVVKKMRIYKPEELTACSDYKKRPTVGYKEPKCQCEECLKNDSLAAEEMEGKDA